MANIKRANTSGITKTGSAVADVVDAPTIGTATDAGTGDSVTVSFTPATTGGTATSYGAISTPGSLTGTSASSPITVSGLTAGTSYTFRVYGINSTGTWSNVLSSASNSATPVDPSGTFLIQRIAGTGSSGTITFSSIPQTYKHLQIRCNIKGSSANVNPPFLRFNSDSGSNYARHRLYGNGSSVLSGAISSTTLIGIGTYASTLDTTYPMTCIVDIYDYTSTSKFKTVNNLGGIDMNGSGEINLSSGLWMSTSAINALTINVSGVNFTSDSTFALYGIAG